MEYESEKDQPKAVSESHIDKVVEVVETNQDPEPVGPYS
jgi:hypothetical protein